MNDHVTTNAIALGVAIVIIATLTIFAGVLPALGHGGKSHGETNFSSLQAVQKAMELYDRLITGGKLPEAWETELASIQVNTRKSKGKGEYVVQFIRAEGDPGSVYFFFDLKGDYSGSNFTGK